MKLHLHVIAPLLLTIACGTSSTTPSTRDARAKKPTASATKPNDTPTSFVGVVSSKISKVITADFDGRVLELYVRNGQPVRQGDVVAKLDDSELASKLEQAHGNLRAARGRSGRAGAALRAARQKVASLRGLVAKGIASQAELDIAIAEAGQYGADGGGAGGEIAAAQAQIAELEQLRAGATVRAPIDGVVSIVAVKEGQIAQRGTAIARVFDPRQPVIRFAVPPAHKSAVKPDTRIELELADRRGVIPAVVRTVEEDDDPSIDYAVCEAAIETGVQDGIRVGDDGYVRIAR